MASSPRAVGLSGISLLFALTGSLLLGCTSIRWIDSGGTTHHVGLVAARLAEGSAGSRIDRYSFGFDVSLQGPETGTTLGFRHSTSDIPHVVIVQHPIELPELVAMHLRRRNVNLEPRAVSWHLGWIKEKLSARTTYFSSQTTGFSVTVRDGLGRLVLGYAAGHGPTGEALDENVVQIRTYPNGIHKDWELVFWKFHLAKNGRH